MKKLIALLSILSVAMLIAGCTVNPAKGGAPAGANQAGPQPAQSANGTQRMKLSDTQYWNYAYLISGPSLSDSSRAALAGFNYSRQVMADGSENITLVALSPDYQGGSFTVRPGQKLYFVETSFGDDAGNGEYSMGDDSAVMVDSGGYVVPIPQ
jgi:hypothetical protein